MAGRKPMTEEQKAQAALKRNATRKRNDEIEKFCWLVDIQKNEYPNTSAEKILCLEAAIKLYERKIKQIKDMLLLENEAYKNELTQKYKKDINNIDVEELKVLKKLIEEQLKK